MDHPFVIIQHMDHPFDAIIQHIIERLPKNGYQTRSAIYGGIHLTYCGALIGKIEYNDSKLICTKRRRDGALGRWIDYANPIIVDLVHPDSLDRLNEWLDEVIAAAPELITSRKPVHPIMGPKL
jgi:hypothetical protein